MADDMAGVENVTEHLCFWNISFGALFYTGNALVGSGFIIPQGYAYSLISYRAMMVVGLILLACWTATATCSSLSLFSYTLAMTCVNALFLLQLVKKHFPVRIPKSQHELYKKVFEPWRINRKRFYELMRDAKVEHVRAGRPFAAEGETEWDGGLRVLLSGKLAAKCDETFLHFVEPCEFVNSIEWRGKMRARNSGRADGDKDTETTTGGSAASAAEEDKALERYQVTLDAVNDCQVLRLSDANVRHVFAEDPDLKFIVNCVVSKDITRKLYIINDNVCSASKRARSSKASGGGGGGAAGQLPRAALDLRRTNSYDAINTGCKGFVRSRAWMESSELKDEAEDGDHLVVLNFLLDVPPPLTYIPHTVPVQTLERSTINEAAFISQQRKYWPAGII